jgi:hypothetical protein
MLPSALAHRGHRVEPAELPLWTVAWRRSEDTETNLRWADRDSFTSNQPRLCV